MAKAFQAAYHHRADYHNAESTATCLAFQYAIEKAGTLDPQKVRDALASPDVKERLAALGFEPASSTPAEFGARIKSEIAKWDKVVRAANIRIE